MGIFRIKNVNNDEVITIVAININTENDVLIYDEGIEEFSIWSLEEFKNNILGENGKEAIYKMYNQ